MNTNVEAADDTMNCCGSCGIAEVDHIKLKKCTGCKSVRYCSVKCQKEHRPQHKKACKKRAAELRDEILFQQPESNFLGDCPICCLPLSLNPTKSTLMECCSKVICNGCNFANDRRILEQSLERKCPFCRHPAPKSQEQMDISLLKRIEANDPVAMCHMGLKRHAEGDFDGALEYWTKAAELGDIKAHYQLSVVFGDGDGVEKDKKKQLHHLEEAAIGGAPIARYRLGLIEGDNGRFDRAMRHWIIAANLGHDGSIHNLKEGFKRGLISKEDLAAALRAHQAAVDATKSPQREEAEAVMRKFMAAKAARQN